MKTEMNRKPMKVTKLKSYIGAISGVIDCRLLKSETKN